MSDPLISDAEPSNNTPISDTPIRDSVSMSIIDYPHLKSYLGLSSPTTEQINDMQMIWEYLSRDAESVGEALNNLRGIERKLAAPQIGESRLVIIRNYIKVLRNLDDLNQEAKSYQR